MVVFDKNHSIGLNTAHRIFDELTVPFTAPQIHEIGVLIDGAIGLAVQTEKAESIRVVENEREMCARLIKAQSERHFAIAIDTSATSHYREVQRAIHKALVEGYIAIRAQGKDK